MSWKNKGEFVCTLHDNLITYSSAGMLLIKTECTMTCQILRHQVVYYTTFYQILDYVTLNFREIHAWKLGKVFVESGCSLI